VIDSNPVKETPKAWMVQLEMNNNTVNFKIDTGAAVTAVPSSMRKYIPRLSSTNKTLRGAGNHKPSIVGKAKVELTFQNKTVEETVYVVEGLINPLLGKPAISELGVLSYLLEINVDWIDRYPKLFSGLGSFGSDVKITLRNGCEPYAQLTARRVAAARRAALSDELKRMEKMGVISKVNDPTDWCSPCVVVPKKDGKIRLCVDYTKLNEAVKRECHPLPTTEETLAMLGSASHFSKLDANSGYWQMRIHDECKQMTTFITPFGRYLCNRLPFGISSAPEIFQREMQRVLVDLKGVVCQMDDILIFGNNQKEHDENLEQVLTRLVEAGITLNPEKCQFDQSSIKFLGHVIDGEGIHADPEKTKAILEFATPTNKKELRRFFGMVNYLGKFTPILADGSRHLRQLLSKNNEWIWTYEHNKEFLRLKEIMSKTPTLVPYRIDAPTILSTDASSYGLGAVILQRSVDEVNWKPVAYASRTLTTAEQKYAQIEKEALAICWGCEKFDYFLAGREFIVETDHKPLISVLGDKELAKLPIRVQRFRLRMMAYSYKIMYTPGEKLVLADALSRAPLVDKSGKLQEPIGSTVEVALVESLAISPNRLRRLQSALWEDMESVILHRYISEGWPHYSEIQKEAKSFYTFKEYLTVVDDMIFYMDRVFIPRSERERVLKEIHKGHQGERKCISRATEVVWWPGMTQEIREIVRRCPVCEEHRRHPREPLQTTPMPEHPWWKLAIDLFETDGKNYLVVVDYYSRYISVHELGQNTTSGVICDNLEKLFCMIGIPHEIVSDNGPQFVSEKFKKFLETWDIHHITSSPRYAQSNGEAERAVQTVKAIMNKSVNYQAALCMYRDTPLFNGYSPAQLLFGRSMNSLGILKDTRVDITRLRSTEEQYRINQARNYDIRHRAKTREPFEISEPVVVRDQGRKPQNATVLATSGREAVVVSEKNKLLRRNRSLLSHKNTEATSLQSDIPRQVVAPQGTEGSEQIPIPSLNGATAPESVEIEKPITASSTPAEPVVTRRVTRTSRGISIKKPDRLNL